MFEADWQKAQTLADRDGVSVDEIIRRLVRAAQQGVQPTSDHDAPPSGCGAGGAMTSR